MPKQLVLKINESERCCTVHMGHAILLTDMTCMTRLTNLTTRPLRKGQLAKVTETLADNLKEKNIYALKLG